MNIALFTHSIRSDWNHGNAHFLRGIATELQHRGHQVRIFEPRGGWSVSNLLLEHGEDALSRFYSAFPTLRSVQYELETLDLDAALDGVHLVIVHEWSEHDLVRRIGAHRALNPSYKLLFHDTHHRAVTDPASMGAYDLTHYDGVLAFGDVIRRLYLEHGWAARAWTWHEAADVRVFRPRPGGPGGFEGDLVWIGNWGDDERTAELHEFLLEPVRTLGLRARVYGVRYPIEARRALSNAGIDLAGWLPNHEAPEVFSRFRVTIHVPRHPYATALPGIPTIRPFEALACGIPLVSSPWDDVEGLFTPGRDFLVARDGAEMKRHLRAILTNPALARSLAAHGRETIRNRHTCAHRVDHLLNIYEMLQNEPHARPAALREVVAARGPVGGPACWPEGKEFTA